MTLHVIRRAAGLAAGLSLSLALSACVTVFPKTPPGQLYRFDLPAAPAAAPPEVQGPGFAVWRAPSSFAHGAEGDRILTMTGDRAAYIAQARWLASAAVLFDEAESRAFDRSGGPAHLARRGEAVSAPVTLRLDVQDFEVRYDEAGASPTVVVSVRASLTRVVDRKYAAIRIFESRQPISSNRVSAIVPGFDAAVGEVLGQVVAWTNVEGAGPASSVATSVR